MSVSFWSRNGLFEGDQDLCLVKVRERYAGYDVQEVDEQGGCGFTLVLSPRQDLTKQALVVQLRAQQHALDSNITSAAKDVYRDLAPSVRKVDLALPGKLQVYEMEKMRGVSLSRVLSREGGCMLGLYEREKRLISNLAGFVARSWTSDTCSFHISRSKRADSPLSDAFPASSQCMGKVGSTILNRLELLSRELPDEKLCNRARQVLQEVEDTTDWPTVLTHGDLIPSNILVDEDTWGISGVVDWAEAEYLPFGMALYALELLLGIIQHRKDEYEWTYYDNAEELRGWFWKCLVDRVPELEGKLGQVRLWRDVGVLLWFGIAWDGGKIERVINEDDDRVCLVQLRAFLEVP